jgi:sulfite exporter TauE/SafE
MISQLDLLGFLTLGLLGGFGHCTGMCTPFVMFVSRRARGSGAHRGVIGLVDRSAVITSQLSYTAGRVLTYSILGAVAGALGGVVELAGALLGVQRAAAVVAGAMLIAWAAAALSETMPALYGTGTGFARLAGRLKGRVPGHPFVLGLFLGLLPCGLLYSAIIAAVALGSAIKGAIALALFGIGTAAALFGVAFADELLAHRRATLNRLSQVFLLVMGIWFLWMGLGR